jgi:hypothetical protein
MAAIKAKVNRDTLKMIVYEGEGMVVMWYATI